MPSVRLGGKDVSWLGELVSYSCWLSSVSTMSLAAGAQ